MTEIKINGVKIEKEIEIFKIVVNDKNYILVRKKLESEQNKIIKYLKELRELGIIKSIKKPKNKRIKDQLNRLINTKKEIKKSINQIKQVFYK
jgi:ferritin